MWSLIDLKTTGTFQVGSTRIQTRNLSDAAALQGSTVTNRQKKRETFYFMYLTEVRLGSLQPDQDLKRQLVSSRLLLITGWFVQAGVAGSLRPLGGKGAEKRCASVGECHCTFVHERQRILLSGHVSPPLIVERVQRRDGKQQHD